jgi:hypothetical protein
MKILYRLLESQMYYDMKQLSFYKDHEKRRQMPAMGLSLNAEV